MARTQVEPNSEFIKIQNEWAQVEGVLYSPPGPRPKVAFLRTHPFRPTNLMQWPCHELAERGIALLRINNRGVNTGAYPVVVEDIALDIAAGITELRTRGFEKIVLFGHSAGSPLLSYYANLAENGNSIFHHPELVYQHAGFFSSDGAERRVPRVDGLLIQGITMGLPSDLPRIDPSVIDEDRPDQIDPSLDMYSPDNGWDPATRSATYQPDFIERYYQGQSARLNRITDRVLERLANVNAGKEPFPEDGVVIVGRTRANPNTADMSLTPQTRGEYRELPSGELRVIAHDSKPEANPAANREFRGAAVQTLTAFLSQTAARGTSAKPMPTREECGINFKSNVSFTANSLEGISVPLAMMFGTADRLMDYGEVMYSFAKSQDKQLVFVRGGTHFFEPVRPGFGDTQKACLDFVEEWTRERFA